MRMSNAANIANINVIKLLKNTFTILEGRAKKNCELVNGQKIYEKKS